MTALDVILSLVFVLIIIFLIIEFTMPIYVLYILTSIVNFILLRFEKVLNYIWHKSEEPTRHAFLLIKIYLKLQRVFTFIFDKSMRLIYFLYTTLPDHQQQEMKEEVAMAIRSIDPARRYSYILKEERIRDDGSIQPLDDAVMEADSAGYTVFVVRGRTAREHSIEKDRMIRLEMKGNDRVQNFNLGTIDFQLLVSCLVDVKRLYAPEGYCNTCGVNHFEAGHVDDDGFFKYDALKEFAIKKKGLKGAYANELIINHLTEDQRAEIIAFIRNDGIEKLGED